MDNNLVVVKSNRLIEASYRLNLQEQRLLLCCIAQIDSKTDLSKKDEFKISAKQFSDVSGIPLKKAYEELKDASENLFERRLTFTSPSSGKYLVTRWVSSVEYNEGQGTVELCFAQKILPLISQISSHFTKYNIENIANINSAHAIRIYELCLQYLKIGERTIQVDELKKILGVEENYSIYKNFNLRVLKPSIEQINKHTDLKIRIAPIRENRKIVALTFKIESKMPKRGLKVSQQRMQKELKEIQLQLQ